MAFKGKFQGYANGGQEEHKEPSHSSQNKEEWVITSSQWYKGEGLMWLGSGGNYFFTQRDCVLGSFFPLILPRS